MILALLLLFVVIGGASVEAGLPCTVGDNFYNDGDVIYPDCFPCYCVNGTQTCFWEECDILLYQESCFYNGNQYFVGARVPIPGAKCFCIGTSMVMCDQDPIVDESSPQGGGTRCPDAPDTLEPGSCQRCSCLNGLYVCTLKDCPDDTGEPCVVNDVKYPDGAVMPDPLYTCICDAGLKSCI